MGRLISMQQDSATLKVRPPTIVAGMHRSGTSFVSSLLRQAGVNMGSRLLPAGRGNELGHFENEDFVAFHRRQLAFAGYDDAGWIADRGLAPGHEAEAEALEIITENGQRSPWGWKDPRTTLFLDFWYGLLPNMCAVFVYREPAEVIESLFRRRDEAVMLSPRVAIDAWNSHNRNVLRFLETHRDRCILANVQAVAEDPNGFLQLVARRFGLDLDTDAASTFDERIFHGHGRPSAAATMLRHFSPKTGALYEELQMRADLPEQGGAAAHTGKPAAMDAFLAQWVAAVTESPLPALRIATPSGLFSEDMGEIAGQARIVGGELELLRAEVETYQSEIKEFSSRIDRCFEVPHAHQSPRER